MPKQGFTNFFCQRVTQATAVQEPDILRNVICFGICYNLPNQQIFLNYIYFSLLTNGFAGRSLETPVLKQSATQLFNQTS